MPVATTTQLPKVVLVGRTNVGKSTLFNRLTEKHQALTSHIAGTTRDFYETEVTWQGKKFLLIDTGGLATEITDDISKQVSEQTVRSLKEADLILFVVNGKEGLQPTDEDIFRKLKRNGKNIALIINKADNAKRWPALRLEFSVFGIENMSPVSALNGIGTGDLLDDIIDSLGSRAQAEIENEEAGSSIRIAIVGKPNVGKSSLINAILNQQKQITSPEPHTTRDAQEIHVTYDNHQIVLIDTAGIRRRTKKSTHLEKFSITKALEKMKSAHVVLMVVDISEPLTFQDKHLTEAILEQGHSLIIIANKWDLVPDKNEQTTATYTTYIHNYFPYMSWVPIMFTSALTKQRTDSILEKAIEAYQERFRQITDNALDRFLKKIIKKHQPARGKGVAHPYIYHLVQVGTNPPTFEVLIKYKKSLHASYLKFLEKQLRNEFDFTGTPLKMYIKSIK